MTATIRRIALGGSAVLLALGVSAGLYASAQNTNQDPPPFRSGRPGGPGRVGTPLDGITRVERRAARRGGGATTGTRVLPVRPAARWPRLR